MDKYKYKLVNEPNQLPYTKQTQHHSSALTYFSQQAIRAGYAAPRVSNALDQPPRVSNTLNQSVTMREIQKAVPPYGTPLDHLQRLPTSTQENISRDIGMVASQFGKTFDHFQHQPVNMSDIVWREIEKERIREEVIAEEIARRRMLEFEVRREIMMERQLAKLRGDGFPPFSSPGTDFSRTIPFMKQHSDSRYVEEINARSIEDRMGSGISVSRLGARNEIGRLDMVPFEERRSEIPFQLRSVEPHLLELKPTLTAEPTISESQCPFGPIKEKDRIKLLAKPNTSLSGAKRKSVSPPLDVASRHPSFDVPKKNGKEDWSCALCQVSTTGEDRLNDHLRGKRHKAREDALRRVCNGKNYRIGLFPKKPRNTSLVEARDNLDLEEKKTKVELLPHNISGAGSSLVIMEKEGAKDDADAARKKHISKDQNQKKYKFWCETCKLGTLSEKSMEGHRTGRKHVNRLKKLNGSSSATSSK